MLHIRREATEVFEAVFIAPVDRNLTRLLQIGRDLATRQEVQQRCLAGTYKMIDIMTVTADAILPEAPIMARNCPGRTAPETSSIMTRFSSRAPWPLQRP